MRRAFHISIGIFGFTLFLLVLHIYLQVEFPNPNELINSPFPGLREMVGFLETISRVDVALTFLSGLSTVVTGILKRYFQ